LATSNYYPKNSTHLLSSEEQNELDALDIVIGLSREERSYLLSVWRTDRNYPTILADGKQVSVEEVGGA
jgi:hypothetical protein